MIVQLRGTSGSGKSTLMRRIMERLGDWQGAYVEGRKQPLYYDLQEENAPSVVVLGHYESPCGGCDTIGSARAVFDIIARLPLPQVILCEGLLLSEDSKWSSQLQGLRVVYLTTPLEVCLRQIEGRRREAGNNKPLNPHNTANRVEVIERSRRKLLEAGVPCYRLNPSQVVDTVVRWVRTGCD